MITEERYQELVGVCNNARILYMQGAYTGVSDELYDSYMADIREYEANHQADPNSPTQSVNPNLGDGDVKHPYAMLSLLDVFTKEDASAFIQKFSSAYNTDFTLEYKLDGLSVQLIYRDGKLVSASTRGDGLVGVLLRSLVSGIQIMLAELDKMRFVEQSLCLIGYGIRIHPSLV